MSNRNTTADDEIVDTQNLLRLILFALEVEKIGNTTPFYQGVATAIDKLDFALTLLEQGRTAEGRAA